MATELYYAWAPINSSRLVDGDSKKSHTRETVAIGAKVSASDLGISESAFMELVRSGAVRTSPYPDIDTKNPNAISPIDFYKRKAREAELNLDAGMLSASVDYTPVVEDGKEEEEL